MSERIRKKLIAAVFYALYMLAFLLTEFTVNVRAELLCGSNAVNAVYACGIFCTGAGYLLFPLSRRLAPSDGARKRLLCAVGALYLAATALFVLADARPVFLAAAFASLLSFGYIGGMVHYYLSLALQGSAYTGRIIGFSAAAAVVLQFIVQNLLITNAAFYASVVLSVAGVVYLTIKPPADWFFENPLPYESAVRRTPAGGIVLIASVVVMSLIVSLNDGIVTSLHAQGAINIVSWGRLFYAVGLVAAGLLADVRARSYISLFTVCAMFVSAIASLFLSNPASYPINISLMYFYCGFYNVFLTVVPLDLAPKAANPALFAGIGRVARCFTTAVAVIPSAALFQAQGDLAVTIISCALSIAALLILAICGQLVPQKASRSEEKNARGGRIRGVYQKVFAYAARGRCASRAAGREGEHAGDRGGAVHIAQNGGALLFADIRKDRHKDAHRPENALSQRGKEIVG